MRPPLPPVQSEQDHHGPKVGKMLIVLKMRLEIVHTRRRQEDAIRQHFSPPHPVKPLQAAIHRTRWSTATTPDTPPPPTARLPYWRNIPPQSILNFVHPVLSQLIDSVVQLLRWLTLLFLLSYLYYHKTCQVIPGQVSITLKLHWNFNYTEENETARE